MSIEKSVRIVDDNGNTVIEIDKNGITFTADNGARALLRLKKGTDTGSVKFETLYFPLGLAPITIVDNIT